MSDFWYRIRRGRCSISIALAKLDFNVHAVSACICKRCYSRRKKLEPLDQGFYRFLLADCYAASVKKEQLFSQPKESLQETTSFYFVAS